MNDGKTMGVGGDACKGRQWRAERCSFAQYGRAKTVSQSLGRSRDDEHDWLRADPVEQEVKSLSGPGASIALLPSFPPTMFSGCSLATTVEGG